MIRSLLAITLWFAAALSCSAGAWMREKGEGFLSFGTLAFEERATGAQRFEQGIYLEYGLSPRVTLGASGNYTSGEKGEGLVFLRLPIRNDDRPAKVAIELGIGTESADGATFDPFLKSGLSWGRGMTIGRRSGWLNVDTAIQWSTNGAEPLFKLDATLGLTLSDRFQAMGQAFLEADANGEGLTVVPSLIYTPKRGRTKYVLGLEHKTGRDEHTGLKFGLWREF